jgi:hypothetical protein
MVDKIEAEKYGMSLADYRKGTDLVNPTGGDLSQTT